MTTLFTVLALVGMIGACMLLIQRADARRTASRTAAPPRWHLSRRDTTGQRTKRLA